MKLLFYIILLISLFVLIISMMQTQSLDNYTSAQPQAQPNQVYPSFSGVPPRPIAGVDCTGTDCPISCPYCQGYVYGPGYAYDYGFPMGYGWGRRGRGRGHGHGSGHGHR